VFIYLNAKLETLTKAVFGQAKIAMQKKMGPLFFDLSSQPPAAYFIKCFGAGAVVSQTQSEVHRFGCSPFLSAAGPGLGDAQGQPTLAKRFLFFG